MGITPVVVKSLVIYVSHNYLPSDQSVCADAETTFKDLLLMETSTRLSNQMVVIQKACD